MTNVLVTGGAGFIGSHLAASLLEAGHTVTVLDPLDPYYDLRIKTHNLERCREIGGDCFQFIDGSITDEELVHSVVSSHDIEVVYHQAAQAGVRTSVENPKKPHEINTTGLLTLLLAADEHGVHRFVNASSSSVYGEVEYLPYDEDHQTVPRSPYGVTKLTGEHYCRLWNEIYDVPTVSLRYFTVYGPRMRPNMAITNFTSRCLNGDPPIVYGDGQQSRDFTYIDDIVDANLSLLETSDCDGEVVNVGSTRTITIEELANHVIAETNAAVGIEYADAREADARHTHADVTKAGELLDYEPTTGIRDGVSQFVDWYRSNREWYEPLVFASRAGESSPSQTS
ncbi:NAD-dependent epimerase/dehydratase family protein [Natrarchaeobius halalkaliphilus]|uniref:NAD-dependent epimerase/dehydratase family protein n=1 Tax=Natrarchaeobius halalkaliphilus TaxID=1679091 RepID=A0A3N6P1U0_9EURY|nr:GDP-mannose 4,6-dehydratase [Natrarchaeobius halalkaliphilus]RQG91509.1 NAD-dependent epimerase/dehydratase family protein [Natrarchaeobius halalkaliphilus]